MGSNDVSAALQKMATNPDAVDRMAAGDFTDLPDADLTEAEKVMVAAAAADIPEVDGFHITIDPKASGVTTGGVVDHKADDFTGQLGGTGLKWSPNILKAARHAGWKVGG